MAPAPTDADRLLIEAVRVGRARDADAALAAGADPNRLDASGYPPLFYAAQGGFVDCIRLLAEHGAVLDAQSRYGTTPLMAAIRRTELPSITALLELGADPNPVLSLTPPRRAGLLAMHLDDQAPTAPPSVILEVLIAAGADPNAPGLLDDMPPLYKVGNARDATSLLAAGAALVAPADSRLPTPAAWHRQHGRDDIHAVIRAFATAHAHQASLAASPATARSTRHRA